MVRNLDLIVFGATGFTGKQSIPIISKLSKARGRQLTWGIAGRSEEKLKALLHELGLSLHNIPTIVANVENQQSLNDMARRARVVINCCGPYRFFGEPVVKACVEEGTHHVDISGEPQYMENMQVKYHSLAREKGVYVVSGCGFDSVPTDLGVVFLQKKFNGILNSVETYLDFWVQGEPVPGPLMNYATWESAIHGVAHGNELGELRKKLFKSKPPRLQPKLKTRSWKHKNDFVKGWVCPLLGADRSVVRRSQHLFYESQSKRPVQIETYVLMKSFVNVAELVVSGLMLPNLAKSDFGRNLLLKNPSVFSGGIFNKEAPSMEKVEKSYFSLTLYGEGWKSGTSQDQPVDAAICAQIKGRNPFYGSANTCLVLSAIKIITEPDKMPLGGGVYPPGYAFAETSLIEELNENEVTFEMLFKKNLIPMSKY